jgi:abhydrolase domain-containing protein 14
MMSKNEASRFVTVNGLKLRVKTSHSLISNPSKPILVLLHGYSFSLDEWEKIGTLDELSRHEIPYVALDLPKGKSTKSQKREESSLSAYVPLLRDVFRNVGVDPSSKLIIVGPSMGGGFALQYALENKSQVVGLVLIAPSLSGVDIEYLEDLDLPILLIWGDKDTVFPVEEHGRKLKAVLPHSKLLIIKGARHPAYLDRPQEFHELLMDFIEEMSSS